ncbi:hypothetical protein LINGRAHAP2_LOCUS8574 [Linum grandiflorum]
MSVDCSPQVPNSLSVLNLSFFVILLWALPRYLKKTVDSRILKISYSTVAHTLDFFLKSKGCSYIPGFISHLRWTLVVDDFLMIRLYGYNVFAFCFVVISLLRTKSCCKLLTPSAMKAGFEIKLGFVSSSLLLFFYCLFILVLMSLHDGRKLIDAYNNVLVSISENWRRRKFRIPGLRGASTRALALCIWVTPIRSLLRCSEGIVWRRCCLRRTISGWRSYPDDVDYDAFNVALVVILDEISANRSDETVQRFTD